ncbi:MAG: FlgD immunoglobulin-like domain containing protein, partial [Calditrichaceae bacterium]
KGEVSLNWRTESEINNRYWLIQKKEDTPTDSLNDESGETSSEQYETFARLDGEGTKSTETVYNFLDKEVSVGKKYSYRLVDVSINGRKHIHDAQSVFIGFPERYELFQNYPNPFNPVTNILYELPVDSDVDLRVYNILGQKVATLINQEQAAGYCKVVWQGKNSNGISLASGIYILVIKAQSKDDSVKKTFTKSKKYHKQKKFIIKITGITTIFILDSQLNKFNNVHPIGFTDAYGYVYPPAWLFFITLFLSIIEYAALNTVFTIKKMENQDLD